MKDFLTFLLGALVGGFITGMVVTVTMDIKNGDDNNNSNVRANPEYFEKPGSIILDQGEYMKVIQVLESGDALVRYNYDTLALLIYNGDGHYYDNMDVRIPKSKCARHIGTFRYENRLKNTNTVPVIKIMNR